MVAKRYGLNIIQPMSEQYRDDAAEFERMLLWDDVVETFRTNAYECGIQMQVVEDFYTEEEAITFVLTQEYDKQLNTIQLWAKASDESLISEISIRYITPMGEVVLNYEITPLSMHEKISTSSFVDKNTLMTIRADVQECKWDKKLSAEDAQEERIFLD